METAPADAPMLLQAVGSPSRQRTHGALPDECHARSGRLSLDCCAVERHDAYMATLEDASVRQNIVPFAQFIGKLVCEGLEGKTVAKVPEPRS